MKKLLYVAAVALFVAGCSGSGKSDDSSKNDSGCSTACACADSADETSTELSTKDKATAAYKKADDYFNEKKYNEAIEWANKAVELADTYDDARELIGMAYFELMEWQKAQKAFDSISKQAPDAQRRRTRYWTAHCMFRVLNFEGTLDVLDELAGHQALDHSGHNLRAYALIELKRNDEAIDALKLAIALVPEGEEKAKYETALKHLQK